MQGVASLKLCRMVGSTALLDKVPLMVSRESLLRAGPVWKLGVTDLCVPGVGECGSEVVSLIRSVAKKYPLFLHHPEAHALCAGVWRVVPVCL